MDDLDDLDERPLLEQVAWNKRKKWAEVKQHELLPRFLQIALWASGETSMRLTCLSSPQFRLGDWIAMLWNKTGNILERLGTMLGPHTALCPRTLATHADVQGPPWEKSQLDSLGLTWGTSRGSCVSCVWDVNVDLWQNVSWGHNAAATFGPGQRKVHLFAWGNTRLIRNLCLGVSWMSLCLCQHLTPTTYKYSMKTMKLRSSVS